MKAPFSWAFALLAGLVVGSVATAVGGLAYILRTTGEGA